MHLRKEVLTEGAPRDLTPAEGLARMPQPPRTMLPLLGCEDWVELPVLDRTRWRGW